MVTYLGKHLTVDGVCGGVGKDLLKDFSFFYQFLESFPKKIDMIPISSPFVIKYLNPPDPAWGLTGFIIISTSHISFHTFPEKNTLHFDCFFCRSFEEELIVNHLRGIFNFTEVKIQVLD